MSRGGCLGSPFNHQTVISTPGTPFTSGSSWPCDDPHSSSLLDDLTRHSSPQALCPCFIERDLLTPSHTSSCATWAWSVWDCCSSKTSMTRRLMTCPSFCQSRGSFPSAASACGFFLSGILFIYLFLPRIVSYPKTVFPCMLPLACP